MRQTHFSRHYRVYVNTYASGAVRYRYKKIIFDAELSYLNRKVIDFLPKENLVSMLSDPVHSPLMINIQ